MDTTIQPGRPRRSSFTQHLQRVLHLDKAGNRRRSDGFQARTGLQTKPVSSQQTHPRKMSEEPGFEGAARDNECEYQPNNPLGSTDAAPSESEPRFYSTQSSVPGLLGHVDKSSTKDLGSSNGGNVTQKNNRRVTMRLEADRIELEKRLLKLEQAENKESTALRRESRRLTKKQPLGSSSRASSASADETKPSSRFSSVFSRRTSRSRSRSSSTHEVDKCPTRRQSIRVDATVKDESPSEPRHCPTSPVPTTLPVRLGAAISNGLAVTNNALLSHPKQSAQPQAPFHTDTTSPDTPTGVNERPTHHVGHGPNPNDEINPRQVSLTDSHVSSDLDRASFAASLKLGRGPDTTQRDGPHEQNTKARRKPSTTPGTSHVTSIPDGQLFTPSLHPSRMRNAPIRSLAENISRRSSKKFTSSPLAGAPTVNNPDSHSDAASIDSINLRTPTASTDKMAPGTKLPHTLLSSRAVNRPNGPENSAHGSPYDVGTMKNITSFPSSHLLESPGSGSGPALDTGKTTASYNARIPPSTLDHNLKTKLPRHSASKRDPQRTHLEKHIGPSEEKGIPKAVRGRTKLSDHLELGAVDTKQNALGHETAMSNVSLSTNGSQDQGSEEYNTADEAQSGDEVAPSPPSVGNSPVITPPRSAQDPLQKSPENVMSSTVLSRHKGSVNKVKQPGSEQPVKKLFVICCHCKSWHDMPTEVYKKLSFPAASHASTDCRFATSKSRHSHSNGRLLSKGSINAHSRSSRKVSDVEFSSQKNPESVSGAPPSSLTVECSWCEHHISRTCCEAWTTAVHMCERQHEWGAM